MKLPEIVAVYVLAIIAIVSCAPSLSCPSPSDLRPCTCNRLAFGLHVFCEDFTEVQDLIKAFKVLRDYQIQKVLLLNLNLNEVLPGDLFDGMDIIEMKVEKSMLKFSEPAFKGLDDSLNTLNLFQHSMVKMKSSGDFSLARLTKLTELNIKSNTLLKVQDKWFKDKIPSVHTIVLEDDEINEIEDKAFSGLSELRSIILADNRIKKVSRSMFPRPATKLMKIDLGGNEIRSIPFDFFFEMPNLSEVLLNGNDLQTLPENTWISCWETLNRVLLHENHIACDEKLDWMRNTIWPITVTGTCFLPSDKAGKSIKEVYDP